MTDYAIEIRRLANDIADMASRVRSLKTDLHEEGQHDAANKVSLLADEMEEIEALVYDMLPPLIPESEGGK